MAIGVFFILLAVLLVAAMPVGGVFGIMSILPSIINPSFPYGAADVARSMFAGMNSFTLLAVPLFMVSGMIMAEGGLSERLFNQKEGLIPRSLLRNKLFQDMEEVIY